MSDTGLYLESFNLRPVRLVQEPQNPDVLLRTPTLKGDIPEDLAESQSRRLCQIDDGQ